MIDPERKPQPPARPELERIDLLYRQRFSEEQRAAKDRVWRVLCGAFFQRFVGPTDTLLDLGCGYGEFSRSIVAGRKVAIDLNPDAAAGLPRDVEFHLADASRLDFLPDEAVDVCFTSNFLEHLPSKDVLDAVLAEVRRVLRPGGRLVAMGPNIRVHPGEYWDFYDHHLPLSDRSIVEAFGKAGLEPTQVIPRFLPLTTRSALPQHPLLVRLYLALPPMWRLLGGQFLVVARKPPRGDADPAREVRHPAPDARVA